MPRLRLRLPLLLLLLLLPRPGAPDPGDDASPPDGAHEPLRGLRERLRAAAALSRRYWALLRCRVWPEDCERAEEAGAGLLGKSGRRGSSGHGSGAGG